jgi:hypothetical protein
LPKFILSTALVFFAIAANAATKGEICAAYFRGLANPNILRFGGTSPSSLDQAMANVMLDHVPSDSADEVQVAMPTVLNFNPNQPQQFGDGQRNALATFGPLGQSPFKAILTRTPQHESSDLAVILSKDLPIFTNVNAIEVSILGQSQKVSLDSNGIYHIPVSLQKLAWDQMYGSKPVFFRPVGTTLWYAVQFPYPYLSIESLFAGTTPTYQVSANGKSVIDPLGLKNSNDIQNDLQKIKDADAQGFNLARAEQVHGIYWVTDEKGPKIQTSNGGVWTRYREDMNILFKNVYLAKDARIVEIETRDGVVSGTGPHYIGARGEIILNSLGHTSLMTFYGIPNPTVGPDGSPLAWGFSNQWVGTWLKPGQAFVTQETFYHWHLNHLQSPIAAQVITPPLIPSEENHFGFPKK